MRITLRPQLREDTLEIERFGDTLFINGESFDFSGLADGQLATVADLGLPFTDEGVRRTGGVIEVSLILPHDADAPEMTRFPEVIENPADGPIDLPPRNSNPNAAPEEGSEL